MERYEILGELARGANGIVYRVRDRERGRIVALKRLRAESPSPVARERFRREGELAAGLDHPGIVPVLDFGIDDEHPYFTMPLVEGMTLASLLKDGELSPPLACSVGGRVAWALAYLHGRDILHRDLKPANILLDDGGRVLLTDFGVAKEVGRADGLTLSGELLGTPLYMSPEQMSPEGHVGPSSDIFSFGCVLYEMLCGRPPFEAETLLELSARVLSGDVRPPGTSTELDDVCLSCLRRDPEQRPQARDLAEQLLR